MSSKVLLVDDEPRVLSAYRREFRNRFDLHTAEGGDAALEALAGCGPFAVVVSDMRMPGMDGAELLSRVSQCAPDTIRVMLTGCSDQQTAIEAINRGQVHQFHTKPCPGPDLAQSIESAIAQYQRQGQIVGGIEALLNECDELADALRTAEAATAGSDGRNVPLLATMGHDLRTSLNHVIGLSDLIGSGLFDGDKVTEYARDIYRSGNNLHLLIENIIMLSQVRSGTVTLHDEALSIAEVIRDCVCLGADAARDMDKDIELFLPADLPALIADERCVKQILTNLLANAIMFTDSRGSVAASATPDDTGGLTVTVSQTGTGIHPDAVAKAFALADGERGRLGNRVEGTGLRLALAKALTELHGGSLTMECQTGIGSAARAMFPATRVVRS